MNILKKRIKRNIYFKISLNSVVVHIKKGKGPKVGKLRIIELIEGDF